MKQLKIKRIKRIKLSIIIYTFAGKFDYSTYCVIFSKYDNLKVLREFGYQMADIHYGRQSHLKLNDDSQAGTEVEEK